ncbi:MAG TPA: iron ABC transporter permease [Dehalococcoidia bacterium]|nr:iron ABC transporter permease [Dehalococcoidia bacterium]
MQLERPWGRGRRSRREGTAVTGAVVRSRPALFPVLLLLLVGATLLNAGIGAVRISPPEAVAIVLRHLGLHLDVTVTRQQDAVLWAIRLPRIVMAGLVGGALALAGAVLQGIFRNPLAEPGLIGVSAGSALGAVAAIVAGFTALGPASLPLAGFVGGLLATLAVYRFARYGGRTEVVTLILAGVALNAIAGALTGLLLFLANDAQLRNVVFWQLGSLGSATWTTVGAVAPFVLIGTLVLPRYGRTLNLLVLGEREARHLGVDTERARFLLIAMAALLTGAAVAVAGVISFVGLVVPHIVRLIAGPDHRTLLPASALAGATLLLLADLFARTVALPREIPLGVVTALAGGPFFLWLLDRTRQEHGGWG